MGWRGCLPLLTTSLTGGGKDCILTQKYMAGLWRDNLIMDLPWASDASVARKAANDITLSTNRLEHPIAATWSWASVNGPVKYLGGTDYLQGTAHILEAQVDMFPSPDVYSSSAITFCGFMREASVVNKPNGSQDLSCRAMRGLSARQSSVRSSGGRTRCSRTSPKWCC
ncbi:hypothetical protein BDY21DRAFT_173158 [Lineolata rhizophorae]|uniref:Uncharacterized protein n=1 Tax=Lineolata rhizophorae TaxID=578093 RepID=A0A6A6NLM3_9PEZI|nr:hypothetical protein BDY21DRAFT_173158 [Lineolata rhizophorae]